MASKNPWLEIPASDYEGHMAHPRVGQLQLLNEIFQRVLKEHRPKVLAVLGCTTGNGFEHIDFSKTEKVVGVDINPDYLRILENRFRRHMDKIELLCRDINDCHLDNGPFDLIHGALVFEYVNPADSLKTIRGVLKETGVFTAVLQLPTGQSGPVAKTEYASLEKLAPVMTLQDNEAFVKLAKDSGLYEIHRELIPLPAGKVFYFGKFKRDKA